MCLPELEFVVEGEQRLFAKRVTPDFAGTEVAGYRLVGWEDLGAYSKREARVSSVAIGWGDLKSRF